MIKYKCDGCGRQLQKEKLRYISKVEIYAAPRYEFTEDELKQDYYKELKRVYEEIKNTDPKKLEEEVYVKYELDLCKKCRDKFTARIKHKEFI